MNGLTICHLLTPNPLNGLDINSNLTQDLRPARSGIRYLSGSVGRFPHRSVGAMAFVDNMLSTLLAAPCTRS